MKHLAAVGMSVLLAHRSARMPSGGVLSADRAAVQLIVGRWAVLRCVRRQAPRPFVDLMAPVQFAVPPATSRCAARSTGGRPCIAAAIMVGGCGRRRGGRGRRSRRRRHGSRSLELLLSPALLLLPGLQLPTAFLPATLIRAGSAQTRSRSWRAPQRSAHPPRPAAPIPHAAGWGCLRPTTRCMPRHPSPLC